MTLASTVFKKLTFQKISHLNALGSKFDLDVKTTDDGRRTDGQRSDWYTISSPMSLRLR